MSLDYNLTGIEDYKSRCYIETDGGFLLTALTERLIFATMNVDMGKITEDNCEEFHRRYERLRASFGGMTKVTLDEVKSHVGLRTNVVTMGPSKWNSRISKLIKENEE